MWPKSAVNFWENVWPFELLFGWIRSGSWKQKTVLPDTFFSCIPDIFPGTSQGFRMLSAAVHTACYKNHLGQWIIPMFKSNTLLCFQKTWDPTNLQLVANCTCLVFESQLNVMIVARLIGVLPEYVSWRVHPKWRYGAEASGNFASRLFAWNAIFRPGCDGVTLGRCLNTRIHNKTQHGSQA